MVGCGSSSEGNKSSDDDDKGSEDSSYTVSLSQVGVGVDDLEASVTFFEDGLGMHEVERITRDNRIEVIMASENGRGADIALMKFNDANIVVDQNPGKIVFYTADASKLAEDLEAAGGVIVEPPKAQASVGGVVVGFGRDINKNIIEIVEQDTESTFISAIGIGVSDLDAAYDFYVNSLGFNEYYYIPIAGKYNEYILTSDVENTPSLVIMNWVDEEERNYIDNPVKILLESNNPQALSDAIESAGETVTQEPSASTEADLDGATVGYAKDADGTLIEIRDSAD
ncbi:hypothetical protein NBRC116188_16750 [Oceaniserpentilla sp. 4NH20-0058]